MNLIFLDIDGVLNDHDFDAETMCGRIHADKVARLNRILRATGAHIVLSSAWRYIVHRGEATLQGMEWLLRSHGVIAGRLVGVTRPDTMTLNVYDADGAAQPNVPVANERGAQITDWREAWEHRDNYIVIDDLDLGITEAGHFLVKPDGKVGLTDKQADTVIDWLCHGA